MSKIFLGVDIGLSGAKASVIDESGNLLGSAKAGGDPGSTLGIEDGDPETWLDQVLQAAHQAISAAGVRSIEGIGVGALGPVPIVLDQNRRTLFRAPLFGLDARSEMLRKYLQAQHGLTDTELGPDHMIPKLLWLKEQYPNRFAEAHLVVDATGFIVGRLTDAFVMDEITREYFVADAIDPIVPLPPPVSPLSIAGSLSQKAASAIGLQPGVPVIAGSIDSYMDIGGAGALSPGTAIILAGTTLILGRIVAAPVDAGELRVTGAIGGGYFLGGWTSAFGGMLDWASSLAGPSSDERSGLSELIMLPYIAGERAPVWDASASGVVLGLKAETGPDSLQSASRDAIILSAMDIAGRLAGVTGPVDRYRATGGVLQSPTLVQLLSDGLNAEIEIIDCGGGTAAAIMAATGLGIEMPRRVIRTYRPRAQMHDALLERLALYRDLYRATSPLMKRLEHIISREKQWQLA